MCLLHYNYISGKVLDRSVTQSPYAKTKNMVSVLKAVNAGKKVLIVLDEENENVIKAARNIPGTMIVPTDNVCVYDLLNVDTVVATKAAIKAVEEALK